MSKNWLKVACRYRLNKSLEMSLPRLVEDMKLLRPCSFESQQLLRYRSASISLLATPLSGVVDMTMNTTQIGSLS